ncbi:MAG: choice-of-anchor V domain-containing protein [Bacteroidia bacterium]
MKKIIVFIFALIVAVITMSSGIRNKTGIAGYAESPGESNCGQCHGGNVNSGKGSIVITAPTMTGWKYAPGKTYAINVTVAQSKINLFGFELEAINDSGRDAGILEVTNAAQTYIDSSNMSGTMRTSITHTLNGGKSSGSHTFTFNWTAPTKDVGPITFYSAGNAANGNNLDTGDFIYTKTQVVMPLSALGIAKQNVFDITIFPNPATDKLNISANTYDKMIVSIVGINGKLLIKRENIIGNSFFDISSLTAGIYIVKAETSAGIIMRKIVKKE